jgi:hypothetical protein
LGILAASRASAVVRNDEPLSPGPSSTMKNSRSCRKHLAIHFSCSLSNRTSRSYGSYRTHARACGSHHGTCRGHRDAGAADRNDRYRSAGSNGRNLLCIAEWIKRVKRKTFGSLNRELARKDCALQRREGLFVECRLASDAVSDARGVRRCRMRGIGQSAFQFRGKDERLRS